MRRLLCAGAVIGALVALQASPATAAPRIKDVRAFCRAHPTWDRAGEQSEDELPPAVAAMKDRGYTAPFWRCAGGHVLICDGGASGSVCRKSEAVDARRMAAFRQFCTQFPNNEYIPDALTTGLTTEWRCNGTQPVMQRSAAKTDQNGYVRRAWRPLPD
jgi:hypothetical protein